MKLHGDESHIEMEGTGRASELRLTVAAVLFEGGGRELDAAVTGTVLRERQILRVCLCVQHTHL